MGTASADWSLWSTTARLVVTEPSALAPARAVCAEVLDGIAAVANRFESSSEISRLADDGLPQQLSPLLTELIEEALAAAVFTQGAVDPTVGAALVELGYDRDITLIQRGDKLTAQVRRVPGWRTMRLQDRTLTLPPGVRLDLGATAKASAADRCAQAVAEQCDTGVLISLGGDVATAGPAPEAGWQITVQDLATDRPHRITLGAGFAIATSSTVRRTWQRGTEAMHHLIDPATARPADGPWRTATVVAPSCVLANTATTAALVKGAAAGDWLTGTGLPALLIDRAGTAHSLNAWPMEVAA